MWNSDKSWARQFAEAVDSIPLRQTDWLTIPISVLNALRTTAFTVLPDSAVPENRVPIAVRCVIVKPAGPAWVVPNSTLLKIGYNNQLFATGGHFHIEVSPNLVGVGELLDQTGEGIANFNGPSFSWTGAAQIQVLKTATQDYKGRGLRLFNNHATTDVTAGTELFLKLWYHLMPIKVR